MSRGRASDNNRGAPLVIYERYSRRSIGVQLVLYFAGVVLAWWVARFFDGSFLILLFVLPALWLSFTALNLFFRFLDPGKRIGIYEEGVSLDRRFFGWSEIEKIGYSRVRVTKDSGGSHTDLKYQFYLRSGKEHLMQLTDETLPFHFDHEELMEMFRQMSATVFDELGPIEHREGIDHQQLCARDPALAKQLRHEFREVFANAVSPSSVEKTLASLEGRESRTPLPAGSISIWISRAQDH